LSRLLVQALDIPCFANLNGRIAVDLKKIPCRKQGANSLPIICERRNECSQRNRSGLQKQLGHFAHAADAFMAIARRKAKVATQGKPDVIAIQNKRAATSQM
jgi:hypothetical protein